MVLPLGGGDVWIAACAAMDGAAAGRCCNCYYGAPLAVVARHRHGASMQFYIIRHAQSYNNALDRLDGTGVRPTAYGVGRAGKRPGWPST